MVEYEKKLLVSEFAYTYLMEYYMPSGKITHHTNYYYDTEKHSLNRLNFTLRIREKDGKYKATIKQHTDIPERNVEISGTAKDQYDDSFFSAYQVELHGKLETERLSVHLDSGIIIMLDKNEYLGIVDHELEIEYPQNFEREAMTELGKIATILSESRCIRNEVAFIKRTENSISKSKRFFARLEKLQEETNGDHEFNNK